MNEEMMNESTVCVSITKRMVKVKLRFGRKFSETELGVEP